MKEGFRMRIDVFRLELKRDMVKRKEDKKNIEEIEVKERIKIIKRIG